MSYGEGPIARLQEAADKRLFGEGEDLVAWRTMIIFLSRSSSSFKWSYVIKSVASALANAKATGWVYTSARIRVAKNEDLEAALVKFLGECEEARGSVRTIVHEFTVMEGTKDGAAFLNKKLFSASKGLEEWCALLEAAKGHGTGRAPVIKLMLGRLKLVVAKGSPSATKVLKALSGVDAEAVLSTFFGTSEDAIQRALASVGDLTKHYEKRGKKPKPKKEKKTEMKANEAKVERTAARQHVRSSLRPELMQAAHAAAQCMATA